MRNNYDVTLSKKEKQELIKNLKAINDYLIDLVKDFDTDIELEGCWDFYDNVWGTPKCKIEIRRRTNNVVVATNKVEKRTCCSIGGAIGGLGVNFERDLLKEDMSRTYQEYALSLLENWKGIKAKLLTQLEQAKTTKQLVKGFEL